MTRGVWEPRSCKSSSKAGRKVQTLVLPVDNISSTGLPGRAVKHPPFLLLQLAGFQCSSATSQFFPFPYFIYRHRRVNFSCLALPACNLVAPRLSRLVPWDQDCQTSFAAEHRAVSFMGFQATSKPPNKMHEAQLHACDRSSLSCELVYKPLTNYLESFPLLPIIFFSPPI